MDLRLNPLNFLESIGIRLYRIKCRRFYYGKNRISYLYDNKGNYLEFDTLEQAKAYLIDDDQRWDDTLKVWSNNNRFYLLEQNEYARPEFTIEKIKTTVKHTPRRK